MSKHIPNRWTNYKPYGDVIENTKILPLKVPLKEAIGWTMPVEERFTPAMLLKELPRLKYIIDLTNTNRYYNKEEFTNAGVKYQKITVPGQMVPPIYCVTQFFETMDEFMATANNDDIIGVHCTHGVNRSGYLICRYLIQQQGWDVEHALEAFKKARGYPIERFNYVASLKDLTHTPTTGNPVSNRRTPLMSGSGVHQGVRQTPFPMGPPPRGFVPPGFAPPAFAPPPRRGFVNRAPYAPQPFGFGAPPPGFGSIPHSSGIPLQPPPRPPRFRPPLPSLPPPAMRVPGPGFHPPGFPLRLPGPPRMAGPPRLPPGLPARLPSPKMPPPCPPSRTQIRQPVTVKRIQDQKKKQHMRNGVTIHPRTSLRLTRREVGQNPTLGRSMLKIIKEQDFTIDTFEENLLAVATTNAQLRRPRKGRYNHAK